MSVFKIAIRRNLSTMIIWTLVMGLILAVTLFLFPTIGANSIVSAVDSYVESAPQLLVEILGLDSIRILSTLVGYFAFVFQFVIFLSMLFAGFLGAKSLAEDEGCGATEFLFAQPISRSYVARKKLTAAFLTYFIYSLLISVVTLTMAYIFRTEPVKELFLDMAPALGGLLFGGFVYICIGFFFSTFLRSKGEAVPIIIAIVLITYIIGLMGLIVSRVSFLVYASPILYVNPIVLVQSGINWIQWGIGLALIIITIAAGMNIYKKRNFLL
ncbi:MAG: ABC transporter permease subunit [Bacillota bacterium]|nr:ABC transporter permease subunit [Bacillota bacterium]